MKPGFQPLPLPRPTAPAARRYFYLPVWQLIVFSVLTMGLYQLYWMYLNWWYLKDREYVTIRPFWRAVLGIFYLPSLMWEIKSDPAMNRLRLATFNPMLGTAWVVVMVLCHVRSGLFPAGTLMAQQIVSLLTVFFLVPVQRYVNSVNHAMTPRPAYAPWYTVGQIFLLILGGLMWSALLQGRLSDQGMLGLMPH